MLRDRVFELVLDWLGVDEGEGLTVTEDVSVSLGVPVLLGLCVKEWVAVSLGLCVPDAVALGV